MPDYREYHQVPIPADASPGVRDTLTELNRILIYLVQDMAKIRGLDTFTPEFASNIDMQTNIITDSVEVDGDEEVPVYSQLDALLAKFPASSTNNATVRFDGTSSDLQDSSVIIDDNGTIQVPDNQSIESVTGNVGWTFTEGATDSMDMIGTLLNLPTGSIIQFNSKDVLWIDETNYNAVFGESAGASLAAGGQYHVITGYAAGNKLTTADRTALYGAYAGRYNTGSYNAFYGYKSGEGVNAVSTGYGNAGFGYVTHENLTTGIFNLAAAYKAGGGRTSGSNNIDLGYSSGLYRTTQDGELIINAYDQGSAAAELTDSIIYGVMKDNDPTAQDLRLNAEVGIGVTPDQPFEIAFNAFFSLTEDLEFVDAGSAGATEQDWIEVNVGGVQGYIRVFAAK